MFPFVLGVHAIGSCIKFTIFDFGWWRHQPIKKADETVDLYRVYGGEAKAEGWSWTTVNPNTVGNYRDAAGLPNVNTGQFVLEGTAKKSDIMKTRSALPLDGNKGGLPEVIIDPNKVKLTRASGANPAF